MIITAKLFHLHKPNTLRFLSHNLPISFLRCIFSFNLYARTSLDARKASVCPLIGLNRFIVIAMHYDVLTNASQPVTSSDSWHKSFAIRIGERLIIGIQPFATYPGRQLFAICWLLIYLVMCFWVHNCVCKCLLPILFLHLCFVNWCTSCCCIQSTVSSTTRCTVCKCFLYSVAHVISSSSSMLGIYYYNNN